MLSTLPDVLIGIVVILVLSASMSTLSSLVLTSSSTLTLDFIKGNLLKDLSDKKQLLLMRVLIVFFIAVSVVLALDPPTFIAQLMGISWGALAGAFLAPFLYGLFWKRVTRAAVWASFIAGVGITVLNMFFHFIESSINAGAAADVYKRQTQMHVVYDTLQQLGVKDKKIVTLFNKQDKLVEKEHIRDLKADYCPKISARTGEGLDELKKVLEEILEEDQIYFERVYPYEKAVLIQLIRRGGQLISEEYTPEGIAVKARVPMELYGKVT